MKQKQFTEEQIREVAAGRQERSTAHRGVVPGLRMQSGVVFHVEKKYGDTTPDEAKRLRQLEQEHARLLRIVGQQRPLIEAVKEVLANKR